MLVNAGQLYAVAGDYDRATISMQGAVDLDAASSPRLSRLIAQPFVQAERFEEAMPYAEDYYASLETPSSEDAMLISCVFDQLGRTDDALAVFEDYFTATEAPLARYLFRLHSL